MYYQIICNHHFRAELASNMCKYNGMILTQQNTPEGLRIPKVHEKKTVVVTKKDLKFFPKV